MGGRAASNPSRHPATARHRRAGRSDCPLPTTRTRRAFKGDLACGELISGAQTSPTGALAESTFSEQHYSGPSLSGRISLTPDWLGTPPGAARLSLADLRDADVSNANLQQALLNGAQGHAHWLAVISPAPNCQAPTWRGLTCATRTRNAGYRRGQRACLSLRR